MGLAGLTAVFGMGTGGTPPVWSPEIRPAGDETRRTRCAVFRIGGQSRPGKVDCGRSTPPCGPQVVLGFAEAFGNDLGECPRSVVSPVTANGSGWSSISAVRTGRLRRSPAVHSRPIDLVVFQEPSHIKCWKPRLEEGFALRCLQRLSFPDLATRRCP